MGGWGASLHREINPIKTGGVITTRGVTRRPRAAVYPSDDRVGDGAPERGAAVRVGHGGAGGARGLIPLRPVLQPRPCGPCPTRE